MVEKYAEFRQLVQENHFSVLIKLLIYLFLPTHMLHLRVNVVTMLDDHVGLEKDWYFYSRGMTCCGFWSHLVALDCLGL